MTYYKKCSATCKNGNKCQNKAKKNGRCAKHPVELSEEDKRIAAMSKLELLQMHFGPIRRQVLDATDTI